MVKLSRQVLLVRIPHPLPFHTGSVSRDSVPLRQVRLAAALPAGISGTDSSSGPFPHWQHIPRFSAVMEEKTWKESQRTFQKNLNSFSVPQRHRIVGFAAVVAGARRVDAVQSKSTPGGGNVFGFKVKGQVCG